MPAYPACSPPSAPCGGGYALVFLEIYAVEAVEREEEFLYKEIFWHANFGTVFKCSGLNFQKDLNTVLKRRVEF